MEYTDFSKIVLTEEEQILFDRFSKSDIATFTKEEFFMLKEKGLVRGSLGGKSSWFPEAMPESGECKISQLGKELRVYQKQQDTLARKNDRRYKLTTAIAILALLLSVASIAWQMFTWIASSKTETKEILPKEESIVSQYITGAEKDSCLLAARSEFSL